MYQPAHSREERPDVLRAQVARANPVWREFTAEVEALVIFQGPQAYVTLSWYPRNAD